MVTPERLVRVVAARAEVLTEQLTGHNHNRVSRHGGPLPVVQLRQMIQYVLRYNTRLSFPQLGARLGYDHGTIRHNVKATQERLRRKIPAYLEAYRLVTEAYDYLDTLEQLAAEHLKRTHTAPDSLAQTPDGGHR